MTVVQMPGGGAPPSAGTRRSGERVRRWAVVAGAVAVVGVVGGLWFGQHPAVPGGRATPVVADGVVRAARGLGALWFCPGGTSLSGGAAPTVVVSNPTGPAVSGQVTATSSTGRTRTVPLSVPAGGQVTVSLASLVPGPWVTGTVALNRGGVAVSETVVGSAGWSTGPCVASTASRWVLPAGSTTGGDQLEVVIADPTATTAVVDTTLLSAAGTRLAPSSDQGVTVPAHGLVVESVDAVDVGDRSVAAVVQALSGTVVAAGVEVARNDGASGVALLPGVPAAATDWTVPVVPAAPAGATTLEVVNPGRRTAELTVQGVSATGSRRSAILRVGPGRQARLPAAVVSEASVGGAGAVEVRSRGGVGVVVARVTSGPSSAPAPQLGETLAVPGDGWRTWLVPAVVAPGSSPVGLGLVDLGRAPAEVQILGVAPGQVGVSVLGTLTLQPGVPLERLGAVPDDLGLIPTEIRSTQPVVPEIDPGGTGVVGVTALPSLPLIP